MKVKDKAKPHKPKTVRIPAELLEWADERWEGLDLDNFNCYVKWLIRKDKRKPKYRR